jgi:hypothetical protein
MIVDGDGLIETEIIPIPILSSLVSETAYLDENNILRVPSSFTWYYNWILSHAFYDIILLNKYVCIHDKSK